MRKQTDSMNDKNTVNYALPKATAAKPDSGSAQRHPTANRNAHGSHQGDTAVNCDKNC